MRVFMIGATGYIGGAVTERLREKGHDITALARSDRAVRWLRERGMTPVSGAIEQHEVLQAAAAGADAVIYAAAEFTPEGFEAENAAVKALLHTLVDTGKPFVFTSGVGVLGNSNSSVLEEDSPYAPWPLVARRVDTEQAVVAAAGQRVRTVVLRPGMVYGRSGGNGAGLYVQGAARLGVAPYVGDGETRWPVVHVDDLADLYLLALEKASAGDIVHGVAEAVRFRDIADATARGLRLAGGTISWNAERVQEAFGPAGAVLAVDQRMAPARAQTQLGWRPFRPGLLAELEQGSYAAE